MILAVAPSVSFNTYVASANI